MTASSGCGWTAVSNVSWITITSGSSGSGNGTVGYSVAANSSTSPRQGTLIIAGRTFTVSQAGIIELTLDAPAVTGNISLAGDNDWYRFTIITAGPYIIDTQAGTLSDNYMYLYGPNDRNAFLEDDDDDGDGNAAQIVRALTLGTYYVRIRAYRDDGTGTYTIRIVLPPTLVGYDLSPRVAAPGETITFSYTINNPGSSAHQVGLGASIRGPAGTLSDPTNNRVFSVSPGQSTQSRPFRIPSSATPGTYEVAWALWSGTPGSSISYGSQTRAGALLLQSLTAPRSVRAEPVSPTKVWVTWTDDASGEIGYVVQSRPPLFLGLFGPGEDDDWQTLATLPSNSRYYEVVPVGEPYQYRICVRGGQADKCSDTVIADPALHKPKVLVVVGDKVPDYMVSEATSLVSSLSLPTFRTRDRRGRDAELVRASQMISAPGAPSTTFSGVQKLYGAWNHHIVALGNAEDNAFVASQLGLFALEDSDGTFVGLGEAAFILRTRPDSTHAIVFLIADSRLAAVNVVDTFQTLISHTEIGVVSDADDVFSIEDSLFARRLEAIASLENNFWVSLVAGLYLDSHACKSASRYAKAQN